MAKPRIAQDKLTESAVIGALSEGKGMRYVAAQHGIGLNALYTWMTADPARDARCQAAMELASVAEDDAALDVLVSASDTFELAKAREIAFHRRWRAKSLSPRRYGDKMQSEITGKDGGPIDLSIKVSFV